MSLLALRLQELIERHRLAQELGMRFLASRIWKEARSVAARLIAGDYL
jgi:hypothetical protein